MSARPRFVKRTGLVVAALILALLASWKTGMWKSTPHVEPAAGSVATAEPNLTLFARGTRVDAPALAGETLEGKQLALSELRGRVVVLNVWGSWCSLCRAEAPDLARAARQTYARGVRFVGIDVRDNRDAARAFIRTFDIPYPSIVDTGGQKLLAFKGVIPVNAIPSTLVVDPAGRVAARVVGRIDYTTLRKLIGDTLAEAAVSRAPARSNTKGSSP